MKPPACSPCRQAFVRGAQASHAGAMVFHAACYEWCAWAVLSQENSPIPVPHHGLTDPGNREIPIPAWLLDDLLHPFRMDNHRRPDAMITEVCFPRRAWNDLLAYLAHPPTGYPFKVPTP